MITSRPSTPVVAAARGSVPLYDVPVMPTLPVAQSASTCSSPSTLVNPRARPFSQSTTAFGASDSFGAPTVGQPSDRPLPGDSECTTAYPRGTQVLIWLVEMIGLVPPGARGPSLVGTSGGSFSGESRGGGGAPSSGKTFQRNREFVFAVPE